MIVDILLWLLKGLGYILGSIFFLIVLIFMLIGIVDFVSTVKTGHTDSWRQGYVQGQVDASAGQWVIEKQVVPVKLRISVSTWNDDVDILDFAVEDHEYPGVSSGCLEDIDPEDFREVKALSKQYEKDIKAFRAKIKPIAKKHGYEVDAFLEELSLMQDARK